MKVKVNKNFPVYLRPHVLGWESYRMRGTAFHMLTPCSEWVRTAEKLEHRPWGEGQDRCHSHTVVKLSFLLTLHGDAECQA